MGIVNQAERTFRIAVVPIDPRDFRDILFFKTFIFHRQGRFRAQIDPYVFYGEVKLRGEIRDERGREFFGEWGRKYDLVRWGIWYDQLLAYTTYSTALANLRPCHEYYPIPDVQCARSGRILTNPEYDKYNLTGE